MLFPTITLICSIIHQLVCLDSAFQHDNCLMHVNISHSITYFDGTTQKIKMGDVLTARHITHRSNTSTQYMLPLDHTR